jgi:hypothetical protein
MDLKHFSEHEFFDFNSMCPDLLSRLDAFRDYIGLSVIISSSNDPSHAHQKESQHYKNKAVDFVVPEWKGSLFSLYLIAERFGFTGIGIYPKWRYKDKIVGGMHVDSRILNGYQGARWIGTPYFSEEHQRWFTKYHVLNMKNLVDLKIVNVKNGNNA